MKYTLNALPTLADITFLQQLIEVLEFYATKDKYEDRPMGYYLGNEMEFDRGKRAKKLLDLAE